MTVGERIKLIRQSEQVNLTQEKFAKRLGVARITIARIESGESALTLKTENALSREFHVNVEWLRTGEGEMFSPTPITELDMLAERYHMTRNERILIGKVLELTPEQRLAVIDFIRKTAEALNDDIEAENDEIENPNDEIEREVADYRRELILEKKAMEKSDHSHDSNAKTG